MPDADGWESGLSPSEQLILDFVRQGMRDAEIAVRLGVSVGDGKERIDALVRKVGVRDRDDLAGWSGRAEAPPRERWSRPAEPVAVDGVQTEGPGEGRLLVLDEDAGPRASGLGPRLPHLLFTASVAIAGIALLVVSTDGPASPENDLPELREDLYEQSLDNPLMRAHPEWFLPIETVSDDELERVQTLIAGRVFTLQTPIPTPPGVAPRGVSSANLYLGRSHQAVVLRDTEILLWNRCGACEGGPGLDLAYYRDGELVVQRVLNESDKGPISQVDSNADGSLIVVSIDTAETFSFLESRDMGRSWGEPLVNPLFLEDDSSPFPEGYGASAFSGGYLSRLNEFAIAGGDGLAVYDGRGQLTHFWLGPTGRPFGAGDWGVVTIDVEDGELAESGTGNVRVPARLDPNTGALRTLQGFEDLGLTDVEVVATRYLR